MGKQGHKHKKTQKHTRNKYYQRTKIMNMVVLLQDDKSRITEPFIDSSFIDSSFIDS